jgi:hypothetical protein
MRKYNYLDLQKYMIKLGYWKKRLLTKGPSAYREHVVDCPMHTPECQAAIRMYMLLLKY